MTDENDGAGYGLEIGRDDGGIRVKATQRVRQRSDVVTVLQQKVDNTVLAVEPQEVVLGQIETADGRFGSDTAMGPMPIVAMEPSGQFGCAFV